MTLEKSSLSLEKAVSVNKGDEKESNSTPVCAKLVVEYALYMLGGLASVVVILAYIAFLLLVLFGTHLTDAIMQKDRFQFAQQCKLCSVLLFPNSAVSSVLDILYGIAVLGVVGFIIIGTLCFIGSMIDCCREDQDGRAWRQSVKKNSGLILLGVPTVIVLLHVFGNIHYQFYCAVGVIDSLFQKDSPAACSIMYNGYTFVMALAGIVLVALFCLVVCLLCTPGVYYMRKRVKAVKNTTNEKV